MKKVIKNTLYDTDTATQLAQYKSKLPVNDFAYYTEELYRTKFGKYFLYGEGGGNSRYGEWHGNSGGPGEKIIPMSYDDATEWAQKNLNGDEYIKIFGEPDDGEKCYVTITLTTAARNRLDKLRAENGTTISETIEKMIMG